MYGHMAFATQIKLIQHKWPQWPLVLKLQSSIWNGPVAFVNKLWPVSLALVLLGNPHVGSMGDFQRCGSAGLPPEPWFPHPGGNELVTLPPVPGFVCLAVLGYFAGPCALGCLSG